MARRAPRVEPLTMVVAQAIEQLIADPAHAQHMVRRDVPMLASDWGAKDEDALIHTLGINLLGSMGKAAGYMSLIEYPVPRAQRWQNKLVRVDAAWIDRQTRQPAALVEFERFSMDTVLAKQTNLYIAAHGCAVPPAVLLLCVWALDGVSVNTSWYEVNRPLPRTWRAKRHATCKLAHAACAGCVWQSRRTVTLSEISEMQVTVPHFHLASDSVRVIN